MMKRVRTANSDPKQPAPTYAMDRKSKSFYDRLLERVDRLDPASLQTYLLRLINEKGFFEGIFNTIREGIIVIDNDLKIRFVNSACETLLGIGPSDVDQYIGRFIKHIDWEQMLSTNPEAWGNFSRREMEVFYPEHRYLTFYIMPVAERPNMAKVGLPLATLIFHDVTDVCVANEKQVETQKVKAITQLAAGVAHELGNPLNSLGIHLQLLQRALNKNPSPTPELANAGEHLDIAIREVGRLDSIVKNFLNAVRPVPPQLRPLDLHQLLATAIGFMRQEIEDKKIRVDISFPESIPSLLGDRDQLTQAFYNIIKNAIQAMPDGGQLHIACSVNDLYVNLKFVDSGRGISEQELSRILEPYYSNKSNGTGLGLIIVDRIVRAHGGELAIESQPGRGAAFTISLPRQARVTRQLQQSRPSPEDKQ
ncbi:MAG: PAS domain-containing protein [Lentisphaerae bacterium]|nr:PAS domain-containing protein [Lentisphaerota bacterium]